MNVLFSSPYRIGTLVSSTLLGLVIVVAIVAHIPVEVVDGDGSVYPTGFIVECYSAVDSTCIAVAFGCGSSTAGATSAAAAAASSTPSVSVAASPAGTFWAGVGFDVVWSRRFRRCSQGSGTS